MDPQQLISQVANANSVNNATGGMLSGLTPAWIFGGIIFGLVGFAAFGYGKKTANYKPMAIGLALMIYPYFVKNSLVLYLVGAVLTVLLFYPRD